MTRRFGFVAVLVAIVVSSSGFAQEQSEPKQFVGEGIIVAFEKHNRYPVMPHSRGIATFVEFWVVRIHKWANEPEPLKTTKYFRVMYDLYERGLTDCEINAPKLRIKFRERRESEHTDCYSSSHRELSDYIKTTPGKLDSIPPLDSLPCLIAAQPPIVIQE